MCSDSPETINRRIFDALVNPPQVWALSWAYGDGLQSGVNAAYGADIFYAKYVVWGRKH